jgi:hypothetical protein
VDGRRSPLRLRGTGLTGLPAPRPTAAAMLGGVGLRLRLRDRRDGAGAREPRRTLPPDRPMRADGPLG